MNEPAFPVIGYLNPDNEEERFAVYNPGLTKRELFAAMAMQGMLANAYLSEDGGYANNFSPEGHATHAVLCADALISQLNASKGEG